MPQREIVFGALVSVLLGASAAVWMAALGRLHRGQTLVAYQPRARVPWTVIDLLWLVMAWPILEISAVRLAVGKVELGENVLSLPALAAVTAGHLLWFVLVIAYFSGRGIDRREFGFDTSHLADDLRSGGLTFLAAAPIVYGVQILVSQFWKPELHPLARLMTEKPSATLMALAATSAIVVAPLSEEMLFRVLLQGWFERAARRLRRRRLFGLRLDRVLPIGSSALLFALMHQGADRVALFVLALFLGFLYARTHRIFPSLVVHACVNALAIVGLGLGFD